MWRKVQCFLFQLINGDRNRRYNDGNESHNLMAKRPRCHQNFLISKTWSDPTTTTTTTIINGWRIDGWTDGWMNREIGINLSRVRTIEKSWNRDLSCAERISSALMQKSQLSTVKRLPLPLPLLLFMLMMMMVMANVTGKLAENKTKSKLFQHLQFDWRPFVVVAVAVSTFHACKRNVRRQRATMNSEWEKLVMLRCTLVGMLCSFAHAISAYAKKKQKIKK